MPRRDFVDLRFAQLFYFYNIQNLYTEAALAQWSMRIVTTDST